MNNREENRKRARRDRSQRARWIVSDSIKRDRRYNFNTDLDEPFVQDLISRGCSYCKDLHSLMTLDRKDNTQGHLKNNVVASCQRCNFIRRSMPWAAWVCLVPLLQSIREKGLFGVWDGRSLGFSRQRRPLRPPACGSSHGIAKLTETQVEVIKLRLRNGEGCTEIARDYKVDKSTISSIKRGHTWKHV